MDVAILNEVCESSQIRKRNGDVIDIGRTSISRAECDFLGGIIAADTSIRQTLEIGCAYGVASLCICQALCGRPNAHHTILDPFQTRKWKGAGVELLEQAGCDWFELREEPSELAMPQLLRERPESFDLIFIDGYHSFDHTLIDLFYANRLVRVGGLIVVDDANRKAVAKALAYYLKYPAYKLHGQMPAQTRFRQSCMQLLRTLVPPQVAGWLIPRIPYDYVYAHRLNTSMVALQKIAPDVRGEKWFASF